jgi:hypothetical protein
LVVASGVVSLEVVLDPTSIAAPFWTLSDVEQGTHYVNVTSGDPNFHIGTYYYLNVHQTQPGSSSTAVKYSQEKDVQILPNGIMQKYIFPVRQQKVKHFVLQVPVTNSIYHQVHLNFTGIDNRQFYPTVYLNQYQTQSEPAIEDFKNLYYPNIEFYGRKFGDDLHDVHKRTEIYSFGG